MVMYAMDALYECVQCGSLLKGKGASNVCHACIHGTRTKAHQAKYVLEVEADEEEKPSWRGEDDDIFKRAFPTGSTTPPPQATIDGRPIHYPPLSKPHAFKRPMGECYDCGQDGSATHDDNGHKLSTIMPLGVFCKSCSDFRMRTRAKQKGAGLSVRLKGADGVMKSLSDAKDALDSLDKKFGTNQEKHGMCKRCDNGTANYDDKGGRVAEMTGTQCENCVKTAAYAGANQNVNGGVSLPRKMFRHG